MLSFEVDENKSQSIQPENKDLLGLINSNKLNISKHSDMDKERNLFKQNSKEDVDKQIVRSETRKRSVKNPDLEISRDKMIENINIKKQNTMIEAINSTSEFSLLKEPEKSDSLFDKVLTQVKERNKGILYF